MTQVSQRLGRGLCLSLPALMLATLAACGGGGSNPGPVASGSAPAPSPAPAPAPAPAPVGAEQPTCASLVNASIPASQIGLPTTGAVVTASASMPATGSGVSAIGAYCLVSGNIMPVDSTAPNIEFQLALPVAWNSKIMMFGGGGFDGSIPAVTENTPSGSITSLVPLGRGYATFASDSGHQDTADGGGQFSTNEEAYNNFMGDALKKTHDTALYLVKYFYGSAPKYAYFAGGSTGGREALTVVQRWPADWNGAIVLYPA